MQKTNIKNTIFLVFFLFLGLFPVFLTYASEINTQNIIGLVNDERVKNGLLPLRENEKLSKAAQSKAEDMIKKDYFAHISPDGTSPWFWFEKEGYDYEYAGENLAINFTSAEKQNDAWMESPTHRKNILNSNFNEIGVYVTKGKVDGKETIVVVQEFGFRSKGESLTKEEESKQVVYGAQDNAAIENEGSIPLTVGDKATFSMRLLAYSRIVKGIVSFALFATVFMLFAAFTHKLSKIAERLRHGGAKAASLLFASRDAHEESHRIAVKFFPMDMKKIEITHLHHMKQRE